MFLAAASTKRPIAMSCLLIALTVLGLNSYRKISLENLPSVDVPYVTITTTWPGASPEDIEKDIAKDIEDAVSGVEGLKHVNSLCLEDVCINTIEFELSVNVDIAAQDVREKVDGILSELPADAERPVIEKLDINAVSVATMFLTGDQTVEDLYEYADNELSDRFSNVRGVASVDLVGGSEREVWVELDREKVAAANLTTADVVQSVKNGIMTLPGGRVRDSGNEYTVQFDAEYDTIDAIGTLEVVSSENGARRYLSDLGEVRKASEEIRQKAYLNGRPGIIIEIVKKSDGNTVEVVNELRSRYERLKSEMPAGMELIWVMDDGDIVQKTVDSTTNDIISAILLCAGILFAFLINVKTTLIVSITMPVTVVISLFFMQLAGQTLNTATLLAIGLSSGILVSNSIVVLENVVRRFDSIPDRWEAACAGTSEVAVAVLASAGTNVVVMLPIAMMTSIVGRFFTPFAITTLIVNAASILISFTLTPILCALFMDKASDGTESFFSRLGRRWDLAFERAAERYGRWLRSIGDRRAVAGLVLAGSVVLFVFSMSYGTKGLGFTFIENDDWGRIFIRCEFPTYYDLDRSTARAKEISDLFKDYEDLEMTLVSVGKADATSGQASEGVYLSQIELVFKSVYERDWNINDMIARIRKDVVPVADAIISVSLPSVVGGSANTLELNMSGTDLDAVNSWAMEVKREAMKNPGIAEIDATARDDKPQIKVYPNRPVMSDCNVSPSVIGTIVRANLDGIEASSFKAGSKTIDIRVKYAEKRGYDQVSEFPLPGRPGYNMPFETLVDVEHSHTKNMIYRVDKLRTVKILGNEVHGYSTQTLLNEIKDVGTDLAGTYDNPEQFEIRPAGMAEMMGESILDFMEAIILAVFLTYLTLSAILESFVRPFVVLLTLPMALIGVVWALKISGNNISIFVLLGVVLLIGVVVNAAVLIVDKMGQLIAAGANRREAMYDAAVQTFRSVLMVIAASGLGMVPIAMATGIGAVNRIGIGAASVGGIIVSGILTVTVLPVVYVFFTKKENAPDGASRG